MRTDRVHDWIDWLVGYLYEVAKPDELIRFFRQTDPSRFAPHASY